MTFAFGKRAYYLFWKMADGRVTWGANLPSKQYMSLAEARAIPAGQWLQTLRDTYAGDLPGELLANRSTAENLDVTGAIHIMPPVPHWYRGRMVLVGDAVHAPSNSTGQGASLAIESAIQLARCLRDLPDPTSAFSAYERLRRERVERITKRGARTNSAKTPGPVARKAMYALMPVFFKLMNFEKVMGSGAAVPDRLGRAGAGRDVGGRDFGAWRRDPPARRTFCRPAAIDRRRAARAWPRGDHGNSR